MGKAACALLASSLMWGCGRSELYSYSLRIPPAVAPSLVTRGAGDPDIGVPGMEQYHPGITVTLLNDRDFQEWKRQEAEANKPEPLQVQLVGCDGKPVRFANDELQCHEGNRKWRCGPEASEQKR